MANQKRVVVVGGAGFVGSSSCKWLAQHGIEPVVYDNLLYGHQDFVQWGPFVEGCLTDEALLTDTLKRLKPDAVFHFAANTYVGESVENPLKYYDNNVAGTVSLLKAMVAADVRQLVFSSTCAIFGNPQTAALAETHPKNPLSPYGRSKWMVEQMLADLDQANAIKSVCLRYFNAAGADPDGDVGEDHDPESHLIPLVLDVASGKRESISIFGEDYETPDGSCIRDYIHVADLAQAHYLALGYLNKTGKSDVFNLGNGRGFSVKEVIKIAESVTGKSIEAKVVERRSGDADRLVAEALKAHQVLGWDPKYPDLETILSHAWTWHQKRFG